MGMCSKLESAVQLHIMADSDSPFAVQANQTTCLNAESRILQKGNGGLVLLLEAHDYAWGLNQDLWSFAVEIECLRKAGLSHSDLRWLLSSGYLEHRYEITTPEDEVRRFRGGVSPRFFRHSCFVLTQSGVCFARKGFSTASTTHQSPQVVDLSETTVQAVTRPIPRWDGLCRELSLNGQAIKQLKAPAGNQEIILATFEEEHWPPHIDDPLPPRPDLDPKRRLHATINSLNRNQKIPLIRFLGDGTGEGIRWELASPLPSAHWEQAQSGMSEGNGRCPQHESPPGECCRHDED